jgi:hypothetical protein
VSVECDTRPVSSAAETDVPASFVDALTVSATKSLCYSRDPYFRAGLWAAGGSASGLLARALLVLKPDAVAGRRIPLVLDAVRGAGFAVVGLAPIRFTPLLTRELWRYQFNIASRDRADVVDLLLPACDSLALVLHDERWQPDALPGACRLGETKGGADPHTRTPQDLRSRLRAPTTLFNFMHTADEPADVVREASLIDLACSVSLLEHVVNPAVAEVSDRELRAAVDRIEQQLPAHDLDCTASAGRLLARERFATLAAPSGGVPSWRSLLDRCPDGRPTSDDLWDVLSIATAQIECNTPGLTPLLPTVKSAAWRAAGRITYDVG